MPQSDGLVPPAPQARVLQTRKALIMSKCNCGRKIRFTKPDEWIDWQEGMRGSVSVGIPCECGTVNHRTTGDALRWGRTIGAFEVPEMMMGLNLMRRGMALRVQEALAPQRPDEAPRREMDNLDLSRLSRSYTLASKFQAQLAGVFSEKVEVAVTHQGEGGKFLESLRAQVVAELRAAAAGPPTRAAEGGGPGWEPEENGVERR